MPEFSICIPTYEYKGRGVEFLSHLLETLENQTLKDYEVVISDHSVNDEIQNYLSMQGDRFDIKYYRNEQSRGSLTNNTNAALSIAQGKFLKIVYQDDFFYDNKALENIKEVFDTTDHKWMAAACNHYDDDSKTFYRDFYPNFDDPEATLRGVNLMSCPSVIALRKECMMFFNEELYWLLDCEFYYRMYKTYGMPFLLNKISMSIRTHPYQSQRLDEYLKLTQ